jgi:hypothetical protein
MPEAQRVTLFHRRPEVQGERRRASKGEARIKAADARPASFEARRQGGSHLRMTGLDPLFLPFASANAACKVRDPFAPSSLAWPVTKST